MISCFLGLKISAEFTVDAVIFFGPKLRLKTAQTGGKESKGTQWSTRMTVVLEEQRFVKESVEKPC